MASKYVFPDMSKLELLDGKNYNRWAVRMKFYLKQIEIAYVLEEKVIPKDAKEKAEYELKFDRDNKICKGMLLHHMSNALLDIYMKYEL